MAKLYQNLDSPAFYQGWYGVCPETGTSTCKDFNLIDGVGDSARKLHSQIQNVFMARSDSLGQASYNGSVEEGSLLNHQQIKKLTCGQSYSIVLKKGSGYVDIPEFVFSGADSTYDHRLVSSCSSITEGTSK